MTIKVGVREDVNKLILRSSSVADSFHFHTDPDQTYDRRKYQLKQKFLLKILQKMIFFICMSLLFMCALQKCFFYIPGNLVDFFVNGFPMILADFLVTRIRIREAKTDPSGSGSTKLVQRSTF